MVCPFRWTDHDYKSFLLFYARKVLLAGFKNRQYRFARWLG